MNDCWKSCFTSCFIICFLVMVNECCGTPTIRERHLCCRKRFLETNSFAQSWQGMFRSVSGPLLPVLLAASATGGSISLELSLDTSKLWKRSFGDTLGLALSSCKPTKGEIQHSTHQDCFRVGAMCNIMSDSLKR